jgi:hypothetical protein
MHIMEPIGNQAEKVEHNALALQRSLRDVVAEYDQKLAAIPQAIADFEAAGNAIKTAACIGGTWGHINIDTGRVYDRELKQSLLVSAWRNIYSGLNIESIASAEDKKRFEQNVCSPAPFTIDNIRATFGDFLLNPRANILRGMAEVFSDLDPAFKSHDKMKIGVSGLPKRVILRWCNNDRVRDVLNALAAYQRKPLTEYQEVSALFKSETALLTEWEGTTIKWDRNSNDTNCTFRDSLHSHAARLSSRSATA